jgi:DNA-binding transcriptional LysR family regulator
VLVELGTGDAVVCAVVGGLGIAMVSRFVADKALRLGEVAMIGLAGGSVTRPFYSVLPKASPSRSAAAFAAYLQETSAATAAI